MRTYNEFRQTTNNYVFNRVRIQYDSACGHCGVGKGCNRRRKHKYYNVFFRQKGRFDPTLGFFVKHGDFQKKGRYPNWKLVSKGKKQWMDKPTKKKPIHYRAASMKGYEDDYQITW